MEPIAPISQTSIVAQDYERRCESKIFSDYNNGLQALKFQYFKFQNDSRFENLSGGLTGESIYSALTS